MCRSGNAETLDPLNRACRKEVPAVMSTDRKTEVLLKELSDAKTWPTRFRELLEQGKMEESEIDDADKSIADLEERAKGAMKRLGCVHPQTRDVFQAMADMLISWQTFKDNL